MKPNRNYPYQDLSLDDLEGEEWEDIPGVDGYFLISNFGRVKRQQYEMQYRNGAIHVKPEKIIKPAVVKVLNKFKKDYAYCLTTQFTLSGKTYSFTVARLVYYCFVQQFDLDDHHKVVLCQDQDSFNIHPGNLKMATLNEKQQRVVARKRMRSSFSI